MTQLTMSQSISSENSTPASDVDESSLEGSRGNNIEEKSHQDDLCIGKFSGMSNNITDTTQEVMELQCEDFSRKESNTLGPQEFYGFRFSKMDPNITFPCAMYWKVEVLRPLSSLFYKGSKIDRPGGDQCTIRPGDKVFCELTS